MRYAFPYELLPQPEGGFTATFPDVPEAITQGDNADGSSERWRRMRPESPLSPVLCGPCAGAAAAPLPG